MAMTLKERAKKRYAGLIAARQPYESEWKEIAQHAQPSRSRFLFDDTNRKTGRSNRAIYNSHAITAQRVLTAGMTSGLSSPSRPWFRLAAMDSDLADNQEVKDYLGEVERRMYAFLAATNFYSAVKAGYGELGMFGTEACVMEEHWKYGAVCHALTVGEYFIACDDGNMPDTLYRRAPMTVMQAVMKFGDKVSVNVRSAYDNSNYDRVVPIVHAIEPNSEQMNGRADAAGKPWRSIYWDEQDGDVNTLLREEGYWEQPFWAPRWDTVGGDTYGSSPGMDALPDLRELQLQTLQKTQATKFLVNPEKIMPPTVNLTGKAGNRVTASAMDAAKVAIPYEMPYQAIQAITQDVERCTSAIDQLFYVDLFKAITNMEGVQPRNVEEITSRNDEKMTQLGPVIERVNNEKLNIAVDRTRAIMERGRLLPPPPEAMKQGEPIKVEFISLLAQAQRVVGITQIERVSGFIGNLAGVAPQALDKLNIDAMIDEYADRAGAPPKMIRSDDDAAQIRAQRQQQQQQAQMAQMAPAAKDGAQAVKSLAEAHATAATAPPAAPSGPSGNPQAAELLSRTRTDPGSALQRLLGG